ncbi:MAG: hypothetical protein AB1505_14165 [Candidatus Latescibacterota bacterium]
MNRSDRGVPHLDQFLHDAKEHAEREDLAWLLEKGKVYAAMDGA